MQRIRIEGIRNDPWFRKNYMPVKCREEEEVNLDDVRAVFEDIEVCFVSLCRFWLLLCLCSVLLIQVKVVVHFHDITIRYY